MVDLAREGAEEVLVGCDLAGERHGEVGAPVEAAVEGNDAAATREGARDLDAVLDRFCAGGDEDRLLRRVARHQLVELLRQADGDVIGSHHHAGVAELVELCHDSRFHLGVSVAGVHDGNARAEIDVALALDVPELCVQRALGVDR